MLIDAACRWLPDTETLAAAAKTVIDTSFGWTAGERALSPFLRRFFSGGWPQLSQATEEQRAFVLAAAARDELWSPRLDGDGAGVLHELGLPVDQQSWVDFAEALIAAQPYSISDISTMESDTQVRKQPEAYFGVRRGDAALPDAIVAMVTQQLQEALGTGLIESFVVDVSDALTFTVDVVGAGLDIAPRGKLPSLFEWVTTGFQWLGEWKPLALAAAVAKRIQATTCVSGSAYTRQLAFCRPLGPLEPAGDADVEGFTITYELDERWLARGAGLAAARSGEAEN